MTRNNLIRFVALLLFVFVTGCGEQKPQTVAQVIQNAKALDGKIVRVRGRANLLVDPSEAEMWGAGGCMPKTDPSFRPGVAEGWLTLYDPLTQDDGAIIKIAESSFHCEGDYCKITCAPFKVTAHEMYEFVGTLRVNGDSEFILENIDLEQSRQLVNAEWTAISTGNFDVIFP